MSKPMNPLLHRRLKETFGHVSISNPGEPNQLIHRPDWLYRKGRLKAEVVEYGETYRVSCPFCSDTRQRLYVNHHWAVREEETEDDMLHLVRCFNEGCLDSRNAQKELHACVFPRGVYGREMKITIKPPKPNVDPPKRVNFTLPLNVPLSSLPKRHPSIRYLRKRKFDVGELEEKWDVTFCNENWETRPQFSQGRLVIPVYVPKMFSSGENGQQLRLAGWQARLIESSSTGTPKYLTALGMKRNDLLYGLSKAIKTDGPVVLVEGVTDVWRLGPGAVALFGKTMSSVQCRLLKRHFFDRPIVILLDNDATKQATAIRKTLRKKRQMGGDDAPVVVADVPAGYDDPGDCTRDEVWLEVDAAIGG